MDEFKYEIFKIFRDMHAKIAAFSSSTSDDDEPHDGAVLVLFMSGLVSVGLEYRRPCASPGHQPPRTGAGPSSAPPALPELGCELIALVLRVPWLALTTSRADAVRLETCQLTRCPLDWLASLG